MSDFQKAISALRGLGIGVTVENIDNIQHAKIEGNGLSGYFKSAEESKVVEDDRIRVSVSNTYGKTYEIMIVEDAYNCIHDRYVDVYSITPSKDSTAVGDIYRAIPDSVKRLAEEWGWNDTEVREKVYEVVEKF